MARRGYTDIDAEVLQRLANRQDITSTQRGFFIRDAYLNVAIMFKHPQLEKYATNEVLPQNSDNFTPQNNTDIWYPTGIRNTTDGYLIRQENRDRVERAQTKPTSRPYTYYWYGSYFWFEAFADTQKSLKIWYKRQPVFFSGAQNSELDELFDPLIIMEAARIGFETVRDFDEAENQVKLFDAEVQRKKLPLDEAKLNDYRQGWRLRFK